MSRVPHVDPLEPDTQSLQKRWIDAFKELPLHTRMRIFSQIRTQNLLEPELSPCQLQPDWNDFLQEIWSDEHPFSICFEAAHKLSATRRLVRQVAIRELCSLKSRWKTAGKPMDVLAEMFGVTQNKMRESVREGGNNSAR